MRLWIYLSLTSLTLTRIAFADIKEMQLEPVVLTATIAIASLCDEPDLQQWHPTASLRGPLKQLTSLQSVTLVLNGVTLDDLTEDADSLVHVSLSSLAHSASRCFVEYCAKRPTHVPLYIVLHPHCVRSGWA